MPRSRRWISRRPSRTTNAIDTALRFLAQRPRSEQEVRRRLLRAGQSRTTIEGVLDSLRGLGLVDDAAFAQYWVEQRQSFRPRGARLLQAELRQHGIEAAVAQDVAAATEPSAEEDAYRAAYKRALQLQHLDKRLFKARVGQFLARRGFAWDTVSSVVDRLWHEVSDQSVSVQ